MRPELQKNSFISTRAKKNSTKIVFLNLFKNYVTEMEHKLHDTQ